MWQGTSFLVEFYLYWKLFWQHSTVPTPCPNNVCVPLPPCIFLDSTDQLKENISRRWLQANKLRPKPPSMKGLRLVEVLLKELSLLVPKISCMHLLVPLTYFCGHLLDIKKLSYLIFISSTFSQLPYSSPTNTTKSHLAEHALQSKSTHWWEPPDESN